jgi:hypothetical protein
VIVFDRMTRYFSNKGELPIRLYATDLIDVSESWPEVHGNATISDQFAHNLNDIIIRGPFFSHNENLDAAASPLLAD